jgi:hypothetical protein
MDKIISWGMALIILAMLAQGTAALSSLNDGRIESAVSSIVAKHDIKLGGR